MNYRYPGINSFSSAQETLFFGRTNDAENLYRLMRLEQMVVLYGKSGYGKTSLLQAAVLPRLRRETDFVAVQVRFYAFNPKDENALMPLQRTIDAIQGCLLKDTSENRFHYLDQLIPQENSLWYHVKQVQSAKPGQHNRFVLVFDQFEEIFTYPEKAILQFRAQLANLLYVHIPQNFRSKFNRDRTALRAAEADLFFTQLEVRVLFSIRSDYMHLINRLKDYLPQVLRNCYELVALTREQAREAIESPAREPRTGYSPAFSYTPDSLDILLNYLSNNGKEKIESFQLQLICRHIEQEWVIGRGDLLIEAADFGATPEEHLEQLGKINRNYYNACIAKLPTTQRKVARRIVENELITVEDKRRILADGGKLLSNYQTEGATETLLETLKNTYLIRAENMSRGVAYELSHDALVEPVLKAREEREALQAILRKLWWAAVLILIAGFTLTWRARYQQKEARKEAFQRQQLDSLKGKNIRDSLNIVSKARDTLEHTNANLSKTIREFVELQIDLSQRQFLALNYEAGIQTLRLAKNKIEEFRPKDDLSDKNDLGYRALATAMLEPAFFYLESGQRAKATDILREIAFLLNHAFRSSNQPLPSRSELHRAMKDISPGRFQFLCRRYYPTMVAVKGGMFTMGCDLNKYPECNNKFLSESTIKDTVVESFKIAETETTIWQFNLFKAANGKLLTNILDRNGNLPCAYITWDEADLYAKWVSEQISGNYRLPTEAEWEFAAGGGPAGAKKGRCFAGEGPLTGVGWYKANSDNRLHAVKAKKPNDLGLYDLSGNVSEWCSDEQPNAKQNERGPRLHKGGCFLDLDSRCYIFNRKSELPNIPRGDIGFRVVCSDCPSNPF